ncbi:MAG TPA: hypothetical protein VF043_14090 [Ktedonobacteraceae bacterium]
METRGYFVFNLVVGVLVALGFGAIIVLILNVLNHGGWFALISGLIGALLYCVGVFQKIMFGSRLEGQSFRSDVGRNGGMQLPETRRATVAGAYKSIFLCSLLAIGIGAGLYYLPSQHPVLAVISAILGLCLCACLLAIGLSVLVLFLVRREPIS